MAIHCAAAERGGLIKKKEKVHKVKLKAFPTNVGRPKKKENLTVKLNATYVGRVNNTIKIGL